MDFPSIFSTFLSAALFWHSFGFSVIPIIPDTKQPAVKWDQWFDGLSAEKIKAHWDKHPDHELGFIVGDGVIVFDADGPESVAALALLENTFDACPALTVTTTKGVHHYFKRTPGTYAKSDSFSTEEHPERIDVKTGRALVVLPPSTGKEMDIDEADNLVELTVASQEFIDAVFIHNGREAPRPPVMKAPSPLPLPTDMDRSCNRMNAMLQHIDSDCGYEDWLHVLMSIYHETGGSEDGLALANAWSSVGANYCGEEALRSKWQSFGNYTGTPVTVGTVHKMLADRGIDWIDVCASTEPDFEHCEFVTIHPDKPLTVAQTTSRIPLVNYSLTGMGEQLAKEISDQVLILGLIILMYQSSVIYAAPNTGKTLIILRLLINGIKQGKIDPSNVFYINVDDTLNGLVEKLKLAEENGFHMLAEGYNDFRADALLGMLADLVRDNRAKGVILILDTLKRFSDLMDKRISSRFGRVIRSFVMKGGTCISLAHTNKHRNSDGKPVYAGTTDIIDDADCAYIMYEVGIDVDAETKTVLFENVKSRGNVARQASYRYSITQGLPYSNIIDSVEPVDDSELVTLRQLEELQSDGDVIVAVTQCICEGINSKMRLAETVAERSGISRRATIKIIEKYCGSDPAVHRWTFTVGERGAQIFSLLAPDSGASDLAGKP